LHKGLYYGDFSYNDFGRKKRKLLDVFNRFGPKKVNSAPMGRKFNYSNYYGMPYKIYSPTPGYQYKENISIILFFLFYLSNYYIFFYLKFIPMVLTSLP
jgi:hypothetical protein